MIRLGIAPKLTALLLAFGLFSMGLVGYVAYVNGRAGVLASAQREMSTATRVLGRQFQGSIEIISSDVLMLARLSVTVAVAQQRLGQASSPFETALVDSFRALMSERPAYMQLRLISAQLHGLELVRVDRADHQLLTIAPDQMQEKQHLPYVFNTLKKRVGEVYLSDIDINHERGAHDGLNRPTLRLATPVAGPDGRVIAVLVANVDLQSVFKRLLGAMPTNYQVFMSNHRGDFLVHPDRSKVFGFDDGRRILMQDAFPAVRPLFGGQSNEAVADGGIDPEPGRQLSAFVRVALGPVQDSPRFVVLGLAQPSAQVVAQIDRLRWYTVLVMSLGALLAGMLAVLLARLVTQPLTHMITAMQQFAQDQTVTRLDQRRADEVGVLAASLNQMQDTLVTTLQELNASRDAIAELAQHDALTGLPTRALFEDRLTQALAQAVREGGALALMFVDLDGFKPVNDTYGHQVGDDMLKWVARQMQESVRKMDTVARMGGDEFVVLLPTVQSAPDAMTVADKVCQALRQNAGTLGHNITLSGSIGVALYPQHALDMNALIRCADQAMYQAKNAGGNQVVLCRDESSHQAVTPTVSA